MDSVGEVSGHGEFMLNVVLGVVSSVLYFVLEKLSGNFPNIILMAVVMSVFFSLLHLYHRRRYGNLVRALGNHGSLVESSHYPELRQRQLRLDTATMNILIPLGGKSHPIVRILEGWYGQVAKELEHGGPDSFEIDSEYYEACLEHLKDAGGRIRAVADLSVEIEGFWHSDPDPADTSVTERIFLLNQEWFFDPDRLHHLHQILQRHANEYSVLVGHAPLGGFNRYSEFSSHLGHNLLLIPPDLVGGYVEKDGRVLLRVIRSASSFSRLEKEYENLREHSVDLKSHMSYQDLRRNWIQGGRIGVWRNQWSQVAVADRSADYFDDYNSHIRCWIPDYRQFIASCAHFVKLEIVDLLRENKESLKVLEIGFGTGAMTAAILEWIDEWNELLSIGRAQPVIQYFGMDEAWQRMRPHLSRRIDVNKVRHRFERGSAWGDVPKVVESAKPFDLICGSLVLHDLISGDPQEGFAKVLSSCDKYLNKGGCVVFADVFMSGDMVVRQSQRMKWKYWMVEQGLTDDQAENFLGENSEMVDTIDELSLQSCASRFGYALELRHVGRGWSPFQILLMRKAVSQ